MLRPRKKGRGALLRQQHVARVLDRLGDGALVLGAEAGVLTRQDFAGIGNVTDHQLRSSERKLGRDKAALRLCFRRAHEKRKVSKTRSVSPCQALVRPGGGSV